MASQTLRQWRGPASCPTRAPARYRNPEEQPVSYVPDPSRYEQMTYRRTGRSGLDLPMLSLGLWHNFGGDTPQETQRAVVRRAFDLGITNFDLANNYGPPYGAAEINFGLSLIHISEPTRLGMISY